MREIALRRCGRGDLAVFERSFAARCLAASRIRISERSGGAEDHQAGGGGWRGGWCR
jgi:hypothetical protein